MTDAGIKTEDYREITPYWCSRIVLFCGRPMSQKWWERMFEIFQGDVIDKINNSLENDLYQLKPFDHNIMTLGYPSHDQTDRIIKFKHAGIEIGYGNPEWGANPNKLYFIVKHGERIA